MCITAKNVLIKRDLSTTFIIKKKETNIKKRCGKDLWIS